MDAGNTWLSHPDEKRPGGDFQFNRFYKEIAIGSGFGIRADFGFFIIRTDIGIKVRDPQFLEDRRWVIEHLFPVGPVIPVAPTSPAEPVEPVEPAVPLAPPPTVPVIMDFQYVPLK